MKIKLFLSVFLVLTFFPFNAKPQSAEGKLSIEGKIIDKSNGTSLSYANVRIINTMMGTSSNEEGNYQLFLEPGEYILIASYLGYNSDTIAASLIYNTMVNFSLEKSVIELPTVTVTPGINPALAIIQNAINKKIKRAEVLNSYEVDSYTKGIFKTNEDSIGKEIQIVGILENAGTSYFKKPGYHKDIINGRKQTANFPPEVNTLIGSRMVQSFYEDDFLFFDIPIPGPLENNAFSYYDYYIEDSLSMDNQKVYKIHISTLNDYDPGFAGSIFILDKSFDLIKVDVELNRAANVGGLLDTVKIIQQFLSYDSIYMPIDYRINARLSFFGLIKFSFDMSTVMYSYKINEELDNDLFNKAIVKVLPDADIRDKDYWYNTRFIPNTMEEKKAYIKIDSIETAPKSFSEVLLESLVLGEYPITDNYSITAPLNMYHFNRVEGHALGFGINAKNLLNKRFNSHVKINYGFADKKFKSEFGGFLLLGDYRTYKISFNAFRSIIPLFNESNEFNDFASSLFALAFQDDFLDYYYSKGFNFRFDGEIFPILSAGLGFINRTDNSARKNTDFSFDDSNKKFRKNPSIYETKINAVDFNFNFDFRDYIEDGYFHTRDSYGKSFITFGGGLTLSAKKLMNSKMNFVSYNANAEGVLKSFRITDLSYKLFSNYSDDAIPYQMLYALPGSTDGASGDMSFRTAHLGEYFGSKAFTVNLQYNFYDEFFRIFPVPLLRNWNLQVSTFLNAGWIDISQKSKNILPVSSDRMIFKYESLKKPLFETGFGIGYMLLPIKLEFGWRLTHKNTNAFTVGLNTSILLK